MRAGSSIYIRHVTIPDMYMHMSCLNPHSWLSFSEFVALAHQSCAQPSIPMSRSCCRRLGVFGPEHTQPRVEDVAYIFSASFAWAARAAPRADTPRGALRSSAPSSASRSWCAVRMSGSAAHTCRCTSGGRRGCSCCDRHRVLLAGYLVRASRAILESGSASSYRCVSLSTCATRLVTLSVSRSRSPSRAGASRAPRGRVARRPSARRHVQRQHLLPARHAQQRRVQAVGPPELELEHACARQSEERSR